MLPTWRTVWLTAAFSFVPLALPPAVAWPAWGGLLGLLWTVAACDWVLARRIDVLATRAPLPVLVAGKPVHVTITLQANRPVTVAWRDSGDRALGLSSALQRIRLAARRQHHVTYEFVPRERGHWQFGDLYLRRQGPLGLAWHQWRAPAATNVRVYPDVAGLAKTGELLLARRGGAGLHQHRQRGLGTEFESLRDFGPDDAYRSINWTATARRGKLVANVYQSESSQTVIIALDAGRLLTPGAAGRTRFDDAVEAALALASVCLRFDDRVGLIVFADELLTYVAPARGRAQLRRLTEALYDVKPRTVESDYATALQTVQARTSRRALVCLFTDLLDPDASAGLFQHMAQLLPRHLPLLVALRDQDVAAMATQAVPTVAAAYERALALRMQARRDVALAAFRGRGGLAVDALPDQLTAGVINAYLDVKARALL